MGSKRALVRSFRDCRQTRGVVWRNQRWNDGEESQVQVEVYDSAAADTLASCPEGEHG